MSSSTSSNIVSDDLVVKDVYHKQKIFYQNAKSISLEDRIKNLTKLKNALTTYENELFAALRLDLHKSAIETYATEIGFLKSEITHTIKNLSNWVLPQRVRTNFINWPASSWTYPSPRGQVLIIGTWNYPVQLSLAPLVGALAAGNTIILKLSELAPHTAKILTHLIQQTFLSTHVYAITGDAAVTQSLLELKWDYIFFTGSTHVGKIIYQAAAKNLTPVTLELGGKSPCIVTKECNLQKSARKIVWGKFTNAGQTCVAPDYLFIEQEIYAPMLQALKEEIHKLYGLNPIESMEYGRIINQSHYERLKNLAQKSGYTLKATEFNDQERFIAPIILENLDLQNSAIMQEEIFGPLLPCFSFTDLNIVMSYIQSHPKPLALYYFGPESEQLETVLEKISFGGGCVNEVMMHLSNPNLPFGGVGESGIGAYHGKTSFKIFSHYKSILKQKSWFDLPLRYPPFPKNILKWLKLLLR